MGRDHDLQMWSPDDRKCPLDQPHGSILGMSALSLQGLTLSSGYSPASAPPWLHAALEPVRVAFFDRLELQPPTFSTTPFGASPNTKGQPKPPDDDTVHSALLLARAPDGHTLKEILVLRDPACVLIFNVVEHGRRWYRSLVFCSHRSCSLADLPLTSPIGDALPVSAPLELPCGDAMLLSPPAATLVITRTVGGRGQLFIPHRLLLGLLPAAILERYDFWQALPIEEHLACTGLTWVCHTVP